MLCKKKLDEVELQLQSNAQEIIAKQGEIDKLIAEFATLETPKSGIYQAVLTFIHHKDEYRALIDLKIKELALLKQKKRQLQELFKTENIAYEKAKYLDNLEIKKRLEALKRQESRDLDEISVMLYANKKEFL